MLALFPVCPPPVPVDPPAHTSVVDFKEMNPQGVGGLGSSVLSSKAMLMRKQTVRYQGLPSKWTVEMQRQLWEGVHLLPGIKD